MYQHILIPTDGSEVGLAAVDHGLQLAARVGARATVATVTEPWTTQAAGEMVFAFPVAEYDEAMAKHARSILAPIETSPAFTQAKGAQTVHIKDRYPAEGIVDAAQQHGCDLIVMGSHGRRGLTRLLLGSQAARVIVLAHVPVLVYRPPA